MAEDGRPSERGHVGSGCLAGLLLIPLVLHRVVLADRTAVNGLRPTSARRLLLKAITEGHGRVYFEAGHAWDASTGVKVTDRVRRMLAAGWVTAEKVDRSTKRPGELAGRTYYRLTDAGRSIVERGQTR